MLAVDLLVLWLCKIHCISWHSCKVRGRRKPTGNCLTCYNVFHGSWILFKCARFYKFPSGSSEETHQIRRHPNRSFWERKWFNGLTSQVSASLGTKIFLLVGFCSFTPISEVFCLSGILLFPINFKRFDSTESFLLWNVIGVVVSR